MVAVEVSDASGNARKGDRVFFFFLFLSSQGGLDGGGDPAAVGGFFQKAKQPVDDPVVLVAGQPGFFLQFLKIPVGGTVRLWVFIHVHHPFG